MIRIVVDACGTACSSVPEHCAEPMATFASGLASGSVAAAGDPVLFAGDNNPNGASLWNIVDNNGS